MSIKCMTQVWSRLDCSGAELLLALALADYADDQGGNLFPSVATLAAKTRQSERTVQRQLAEFRRAGWLLVDSLGTIKGGRGRSVRYRISPTWLNGDNLSWFSDRKGDIHDVKGCQPRQQRVTTEAAKGDTAMSPDPSVSVIDPSLTGNGRVRTNLADEEFDQIRAGYRRRSGSQPWRAAREAMNARLRDGDQFAAFLDGARRYAAFIGAAGDGGTRFVMQARTFFGPERHYATDWRAPPSEREKRDAVAMQKLVDRRAAIGLPDFREPRPGESVDHYRAAQDEAWNARKREPAPISVAGLLHARGGTR